METAVGQVSEQEVRKLYREITKALIREKLTITTMESATSGQIASLITDTEGSSAVLKGAFITYSNEAKILQGVPEQIIREHSVYSLETAEAMAMAAQRAYRAEIAIGITGTMGNIDPANREASEPGVLYYAILDRGEIISACVRIEPQANRYAFKLKAAETVGRHLMEKIG